MFNSGTVYFVTNRVAEGLPFVPNEYIRTVLLGVIARASMKFEGITICAWLFMGNHYHAILVLNGEPAEFAEFMNFVDGEIAKLVVRWLGKRNVKVWSQRYHAAPLLSSDDVLHYLAYLYLNPVNARLVARASDWEGATTLYSLTGEVRSFRRVLPSTVYPLPRCNFSKHMIARLLREIESSDSPEWELRVDAFAWMECFDSTRGGCRVAMLSQLEVRLAAESTIRAEQSGARVAGAPALKLGNPHRAFKPRKRGRRSICISQNGELRRRFRRVYRAFCRRAARAWAEACRRNILPDLPPGAFCAPRPFRCCLLPA